MVKLTFLITLAATVMASQVMAQAASSSSSVQSTASNSTTSSSPTATPIALSSGQAEANLNSLRSSIMSRFNITATGGGISSTASGGAAAATTAGSKSDANAYKPIGTILAVTGIVAVGLLF
ncbi:hypothetical protein K501DRAFT_337093 [Backusella circina FSU 941]|nr:hypothetical protein K501DRAFT_337093 [Backusella circina FSU 941]